MNLEALKAKINQPQPFPWLGETVYLRKIGAKDGLSLFGKMADLKAKTLTPQEDQAATLEYYAELVSKSLSDEGGTLQLDSDDGREALRQLNFGDLVDLGTLVLNHSGFQRDEKKSTATPNSLDSDSANNSDTGPTPTTSSNI